MKTLSLLWRLLLVIFRATRLGEQRNLDGGGNAWLLETEFMPPFDLIHPPLPLLLLPPQLLFLVEKLHVFTLFFLFFLDHRGVSST